MPVTHTFKRCKNNTNHKYVPAQTNESHTCSNKTEHMLIHASTIDKLELVAKFYTGNFTSEYMNLPTKRRQAVHVSTSSTICMSIMQFINE